MKNKCRLNFKQNFLKLGSGYKLVPFQEIKYFHYINYRENLANDLKISSLSDNAISWVQSMTVKSDCMKTEIRKTRMTNLCFSLGRCKGQVDLKWK